jgi:hypothetical protein
MRGAVEMTRKQIVVLTVLGSMALVTYLAWHHFIDTFRHYEAMS